MPHIIGPESSLPDQGPGGLHADLEDEDVDDPPGVVLGAVLLGASSWQEDGVAVISHMVEGILAPPEPGEVDVDGACRSGQKLLTPLGDAEEEGLLVTVGLAVLAGADVAWVLAGCWHSLTGEESGWRGVVAVVEGVGFHRK